MENPLTNLAALDSTDILPFFVICGAMGGILLLVTIIRSKKRSGQEVAKRRGKRSCTVPSSRPIVYNKAEAVTQGVMPKRPSTPPEMTGGAAAKLMYDRHVDIPQIILFLRNLQLLYQWPEEVWRPIDDSLTDLENRSNDDRLFLGLLGEFSSGKSTLINALLREDLLKTDILPGTTCAATMLSHGQRVDAEVVFSDGQSLTFLQDGLTVGHRMLRSIFTYSNDEELSKASTFIHRFSAEEESSRSVRQVNVSHPNEKLRSGLCIVDTPGLNMDNPRHEALTKYTISEVCDAALIVVPADIPVSKTLIDALRATLGDRCHRCVCIVTKIDLIPEEERDRHLQYVAKRLKSELGFQPTNVLAASPRTVVQLLESPTKAEFLLRKQFDETEAALLKILRENRLQILSERLLKILLCSLDNIRKSVNLQQTEYMRRHDALEQNRILNLPAFVNRYKKNYRKNLTEATEWCRQDLLDKVADLREELRRCISSDIGQVTSKGQLKTVMVQSVQHRFDFANNALRAHWLEFSAFVNTTSEGQHTEFQKEFKKQYQELETLGGTVAVSSSEVDTAMSIGKYRAAVQVAQTGATTRTSINEATFNQVAGTAGSAVAGAGIGMLFGGPVGAAIGAGVGALWGWATGTGPSLDDFKQKAVAMAEKDIAQWATGHSQEMSHGVVEQVKKAAESLDAEIDRYAETYQRKVEEMIERDRKEMELMKEYQLRAEGHLVELGVFEKNSTIVLASLR